MIPGKFRILNPKNSQVICPQSFQKCLFTNIHKQYNMLKSTLLFKKNTNFTLSNSIIVSTINAKFSVYYFIQRRICSKIFKSA